MLPVPIDAPSAVMNAWNGVSTPAVARRAPRERDPPGFSEAPHLDDAGAQRQPETAEQQDPTSHGMKSASVNVSIASARPGGIMDVECGIL